MTISENKWTVVTGANRGLGYEAALQLLKAKHPVIVTARTQQKADAAVERLRKAAGVDSIVQALALDPVDHESVAAAVATLRQKLDGKLGAIVNNAGALKPGWTQQDWDDVVPVNVHGAIAVAEAFLPLLADGGRVVMVSSGLGQLSANDFGSFPKSKAYVDAIKGAKTLDDVRAVGFNAEDDAMKESTTAPFGNPVYRVSKALLNKAVQLLAEDEHFTRKAVSVSAVCPGWCRTDMGSENAPRSAAEGGASIVWNVTESTAEAINGKFFRDGGELPW